MTRTAYAKYQAEINAMTDIETRERKRHALNICYDEEINHLNTPRDLDEYYHWMKEHEAELQLDLKSYKSVFWTYDPAEWTLKRVKGKKYNWWDGLLVSDPKENTVFVFLLQTATNGSPYQDLPDSQKYSLNDWKDYGMDWPKGVSLDKMFRLNRSDITGWNIGQLSTKDVRGFAEKMEKFGMACLTDDFPCIHNVTDTLVDAIYKYYRAGRADA
jgi:hypothetical protein